MILFVNYIVFNSRQKCSVLDILCPRISQAHTDMFEKIHGISHHSIMLNIALGRRPKALEYKGDYRIAANFMVRTYEPGMVKKAPKVRVDS